MTEVYVLCNTDYEDGSPEYVFDDKELADKFVAAEPYYKVKAMPLNPFETELRNGAMPFVVCYERVGQYAPRRWAYLQLGEYVPESCEAVARQLVRAATPAEAVAKAEANDRLARNEQ